MDKSSDVPLADLQQEITPLRVRIDELDQKIVGLLNERARIVVDIGKIKHKNDTPVYSPDREQQVLEKIRRANHGPLSDACLEAIYREVISGSYALERVTRVGYLGPPGSFSHVAARLKFGAGVEYRPLEDIAAVFDEITRSHIDLGLVPIENSAIGGIGETLDSFLDSTAKVCAEVLIHIHHNVLTNSPAEEIKIIYSKPEVFSQCRRWLSNNLRQAQRVPVASSSRATELASKEPGAAAVGSSLAAEIYGLKTLYTNIEDNPGNVTRFFVMGRNMPLPSGDDKTAIMFTTVHKAGALAQVLDVFRDYKLNLTHIDKRPSQRVNWEYYFFVDLLGHQSDAQVRQALEAARPHCLQLTILGSFPQATRVL